MYSRLSSSYILCLYSSSSEMLQLLKTRICQMGKYGRSVHVFSSSILHIFYYQTGKYICKKCLKNVAGENILHIYLYLTTRYICKKCLKFIADEYILKRKKRLRIHRKTKESILYICKS